MISKIKFNKVFNINKLISFHANEFDDSFIFNGEKHSDWEIVYIDKGSVEVKRDKEILILSQGDLIFHRPHEFHSIKSFNSSPNFFVIAFECNSPSMACFDKHQTKLDKTQKLLLSSAIKEAENAYHIPKNTIEDDLYVKSNATFGSEQLVKTYLEQLLILLARKKLNVPLKQHTLIDDQDNTELVTKIKDYIDERLCERITNKQICDYIGYGKTYVSTMFHEKSGFTLNEFVNKQKLTKAKELIRTSTMNIAEISDFLSFDNPRYFCRVFKKFCGMTPSEFRKSLTIY